MEEGHASAASPDTQQAPGVATTTTAAAAAAVIAAALQQQHEEQQQPLPTSVIDYEDDAILDLPNVHTSACSSYNSSRGLPPPALHGMEPCENDDNVDDDSPVCGTSTGHHHHHHPLTHCQDIPSPPYSSSFPGSLSLPSTSQNASSPLLDTSCMNQCPQQQFLAGAASTDLSVSDDQLLGTCMGPASGTLSGFQGSGVYSPVPLYGETSGLSCSALKLPAYDSKSNLSETASALLAICRICHQPGDEYDILISPCRCAGTLQFIHNTCLMKWLEITSKKSRKPPKCELCHYQYHRHKKFKFDHWRFPKVSRQDKVLHSIFIVNLLIMIGCAIATVMCFLSDKGQITKFPRNKATLTTEEIITLSCGVLFFVSFFIAMSVQIKARRTLYQLFVKFIMQNMEWEIDEYDKSKDSLYADKQDLLKKPMFV